MATKGEALQHLIQTSQSMRQSGNIQDADQLDQKIQAIRSNPKHQDLNQQLGQAPPVQGNSPQLYTSMPGNNSLQNQGSPTGQAQAQGQYQGYQAPKPQVNPQQSPDYWNPQNKSQATTQDDPNSIYNLVQKAIGAGQQLTPNIGQSIASAMSRMGGGKDYVSPGQELGMKAAEANVQMTPWKQMLLQTQAQKNIQLGNAAESLAPYRKSAEELNNSRKTGVDYSNQILGEALNNQGQGEGNNNFVVSGTSPRGASTVNMGAVAQRAGIQSAVKPFETQNAKVDSGLHALRIMDQGFDRGSGTFNIANMNVGELNQTLANVISGQGPSTDASRESLRQQSLSGDVTSKINYLTGNTSNVVTPQIAKLLYTTLIGQLKQSSQERQPYSDVLQNPAQNNPEDYLAQSPSYQFYGNQNQQGQGTPQLQPGQRLLRNKRTGEKKVVNG